jgi:hypothetical protein
MRSALRTVSVVLLLTGLSAGPAAGQWVAPPGTGWVKLQGTHQNTDTKFGNDGDRTSLKLDEQARAITTTVRLTGALGVWRGIDVWADLPFRRLEFNDSVRNRQRTGFSDPRLFIRVGPSLFGADGLPFAVAARGGTKFPVGDFVASAQQIPLSEGQRDWELLLEVGKSLHPWPMYVMGWVGYRWRELNQEIRRKPGDERLFYVAAGGHVDRFRWKVAVDGLFGRSPRLFSIPLENERRELVQLIPTAGWRVGPGTVEAGARLPLHGRNFPAGPVFTIGYFVSWSDPLW